MMISTYRIVTGLRANPVLGRLMVRSMVITQTEVHIEVHSQGGIKGALNCLFMHKKIM